MDGPNHSAVHHVQEEEAKALVEAIVEANGLELLVQRMVQFNEKLQDDATAIFNALNIIENLVEVDLKVLPPSAKIFCDKHAQTTGFCCMSLMWLTLHATCIKQTSMYQNALHQLAPLITSLPELSPPCSGCS